MSQRPALPTGSREIGERPLLAVGLVLLAMLVFTATDAIAKQLTTTLAPQQIIWVRYGVIVTVLLAVLLYHRSERLLHTHRLWLHLLRGLLVMVSSMLFIHALEELPLELCTAIGFVSPLYVTALSIPLLGEKVGARSRSVSSTCSSSCGRARPRSRGQCSSR